VPEPPELEPPEPEPLLPELVPPEPELVPPLPELVPPEPELVPVGSAEAAVALTPTPAKARAPIVATVQAVRTRDAKGNDMEDLSWMCPPNFAGAL
jgi:hypothetical protein